MKIVIGMLLIIFILFKLISVMLVHTFMIVSFIKAENKQVLWLNNNI